MKSPAVFHLLVLALLAVLSTCQVSEVTELAGGRFQSNTNVTDWANLAKDIADIREATTKEDMMEIYQNGRHSTYLDEGGVQVTRSLSSLIVDNQDDLKQDAMFNFFSHAFSEIGRDVEGEDEGQFDQKPAALYADTIVLDLMSIEKLAPAPEAMIVMNVWIYCVHQLNNVLRACKRGDATSTADMEKALDIAAALWIGIDQEEGDNDSGNLLYNLAENAGARFDQDNGETRANYELIDEFNTLKVGISVGTCTSDANGYTDFRTLVRKMIGIMTIPLVQNLIHHVLELASTGNSDFIELYSLAVLPRVEACSPSSYRRLLDLFVNSSYTNNEQAEAIALIQSIFTCLELDCGQVGTYRSGEVEECEDDIDPTSITLAGYQLTFDARPASRVDRDIEQIRILAHAQAYVAARDYYEFGYNYIKDETPVSLSSLATSSGRQTVTSQFALYSGYFTRGNYAHRFMEDALQQRSIFAAASNQQISSLVSGMMTTMIMYMAILEKMYLALDLCRNGSGANATDTSVLYVDQAAAFYIGSMEGSEIGGQPGGQLLYASAKELCDEFGVCEGSDEGSDATTNTKIVQAFMEVSNRITQGSCDAAEAIALTEVEPLLIVPLIQGTLNYASLNDGLEAGTTEGSLGSGFAFSRSLLPLIDSVDEAAGTTVAQNMNFQLDAAPVDDGARAVFDAIRSFVHNMTSPLIARECENIGVLNEGTFGDVCDGIRTSSTLPPFEIMLPTDPPATSPATPTAVPTLSAPDSSPTPEPTAALAPHDLDDIGLGRYRFENEIYDVAALSLDLKDMKGASSTQAASAVYVNGGNSLIPEEDGTTKTVTLQALSTTSLMYMNQDPMYNIYRWALLNDTVFSGDTFEEEVRQSAYADVVVDKALTVADDKNLAAETAVVMNVWMEMCHDLEDALDYCSAGLNRTVLSIDRVAALWIGVEQQQAAYGTGHMMYEVAQTAEQAFGLGAGEALANHRIIQLLIGTQALAKLCETDPSQAQQMKIFVADIIKQMTIPLVQKLIYHISRMDDNYVELYALALLPQAIGCRESSFNRMRNALVDEKQFEMSDLDATFYADMKDFQKCLRITCDDIRGASNPPDALGVLINNMCYDDDASTAKLAGFTPVNDVEEFSRLDLDILHIGIFMETKAYSAAEEYYLNGFNSHQGLRTYSLSGLATSATRTAVEQFQTYTTYFQSDNYADNIVLQAIRREGTFAGASIDQAAEAVSRLLQCYVTYMAVLEKLYRAVDECENGGDGVVYWEEGVALFIGSIEGSDRGGADVGDGTFLYALAKETCDVFGTCEGSGDSSTNEQLIQFLTDGRNYVQATDKCDDARSLIQAEVLWYLPVPMFEATLFYAEENVPLPAGTDSFKLAAAYAISSSIVPLLNRANATSATTISAAFPFDLTQKPVSPGADAVYDAIIYALPAMSIDCRDFSVDRNICIVADDGSSENPDGQETLPPDSDTSTSLGDGLYTTTTYVQDRANIALDILAISDALESGSNDLAKLIYRDGENSDIYNEEGVKIGQRSLGGFSVEASLDMVEEPIFNIFRYALQDTGGRYKEQDVRFYADTIINAALANGNANDKTLAAEGMVVLNLWMYLVHELFETLANCKNKVIADDDGVHSIDEAVAYWIGDGQIAGDGEEGHLLYALAERMGEKFQNKHQGQSTTNINILQFFNQAKLELSLPNACSNNPNTYPRLRQIVYRIVSQMTIPLIQGLIDSLYSNDRPRVQMYAQAFVPLIAACDPDLFETLKTKLMDLEYNVADVEDIVEGIRSSFTCLGLHCSDVGDHVTETSAFCIEAETNVALAGYTPSTDVRAFALLDLDILEAEILMEMNAYEAVADLYSYGRHSSVSGINGPEMISLSQMASTSDRAIVPQFDSFVRYFDNEKYGETMIQNSLSSSSFEGASPGQRKEIVVKTMQYMIVYMGALQAMYDSVDACQSSDSGRVADAQEAWDKAAALLIGSIEGEAGGGKPNGHSFYALAKNRCEQFGTCGTEGYSEVNEKLISLLFTGKGELQGASCSALKRTAISVEKLLLVPLLQSNLRYALINAGLPRGTTDEVLGAGFVFSRAVLPLIEDANRNAAETIASNMDLQFSAKPVKDGSAAVFNAFGGAYVRMGVDCADLGTVQNINPCDGAIKISSGNDKADIAIIVVVLLLAIGTGGYFYFRYRRRRKQKSLEEAPMFVRRSNGVLNHDSDILNGHSDAMVVESEESYFNRKVQYQADSLQMS